MLLAVLTLTQLLTDEPRANPALVTVCALAAVLPLAVRRRAPLPVTLVVCAGVVGQVAASDGAPATFASFVAVMICVYTLAPPRRPAVRSRPVSPSSPSPWRRPPSLEARTVPFQPFEVVYPLFYFGVAGGLGAFVRQRALRLTAVEDRAAALEGELEREAELAAAEERARIARELHDVVAHGLSLMVVQAEAAEEMLRRSPEAAVLPLHRVQDTGRQALAEMRRLLGVLRTTDAGPPSTVPQPSLRRIPELVREAADVGLAVEVTVSGEPADLAAGRGARRLPDRAGGAHQHPPARPRHPRLRPARLHPGGAADRGHRRRPRPHAARTPATGWSACGNGPRSTAAPSTSGPRPGGGFRVTAVLPVGEQAP